MLLKIMLFVVFYFLKIPQLPYVQQTLKCRQMIQTDKMQWYNLQTHTYLKVSAWKTHVLKQLFNDQLG